MMDDIVATNIIHIIQEANEFRHRCAMIDSIIMP